ncbi:hypothetical protein EOD41_00090 [Mucilaginibacter limnophilus]|uniref:Uncharacterized protein n=1 Tax=Mucilaginibacter limnophilus TaxID=1932778 RepID=A0A437MXP2_9SPHI|nr:hypothetical protein [Mucilaginibacter limnophilus]RVU02376.1 hypothetical protein EOD41_00090 [Mucilaginibacter limnophilus]
MKSQPTNSAISTYNKIVKQTYFQLVKEAKALLATIEEEPLRYSLIREDKQSFQQGTIVHEFLNPLLYLRLECYAENKLGIHFGWELMPTFGEYYHIMNTFVRLVYKLTMADTTAINIEDCIRTDYVINECSAAYEHLEERGLRHHTFVLIPYKAKPIKRKLRKVA